MTFFFRLQFNQLDTKRGKLADTTTYVCQYGKRRTGGYNCEAMYRIKRAKDAEGNKTGRIEVEKSEADHNDHKPVDNMEEEITYDIWDKEMDQLISTAVSDNLATESIRKKMKEKYPERDFDSTTARSRLYQKIHR